MIINRTSKRMMLMLLKDFSRVHTVTAAATGLGMSRVGAWKSMKELQDKGLVRLESVGEGKTNVHIASLNWDNMLVEKLLDFCLSEEALEHERWRFDFSELGKAAGFLVIYGSMLHSESQAKDIDLIGVVSGKKDFARLQKAVDKEQLSQSKRMHMIDFTEGEFAEELKRRNPAFVSATRDGIVLFGQGMFVRFIRDEVLRQV